MKFPVGDFGEIRIRLDQIGARLYETRGEEDHYYSAPDRDYLHTDEYLRVRCVGSKTLLTYKGPKHDAETKTRTEVEVQIAGDREASQQVMSLLERLRYRTLTAVNKSRTVYIIEYDGFPIEVCLDEVSTLGTYVELEIKADFNEIDKARSAIRSLASMLDLGPGERRSYLELLLAAKPPS